MENWVHVGCASRGSHHRVVEVWKYGEDRVLMIIRRDWEVVESCELAWKHGFCLVIIYKYI